MPRQPNGAAWPGSPVPGVQPCRWPAPARRYSPASSRSSSTSAANLLAPFAMCTPLACSDYYGASAPPRAFGWRRAYPAGPGGSRAAGTARGGSHVPCVPIGQVGAQLDPGSLAAPTPPDLQRGLPARRLDGLRSRPPRLGAAAHCTPAHIRQVRAGYNAYGVLHAGSSRTPSGLACRTRTVWQYRRVPSFVGAASRPPRRPPDQAAPSFYRTTAMARRRWSFTSVRSRRTSWRTSRSLKVRGS